MEQYAELNEKYNQNSDKIKFFEQRDQEQNEAIEKLKKELLNINSKNGQSIEIFKKRIIKLSNVLERYGALYNSVLFLKR